MNKEFSTKWKASSQPRKQRKYQKNAPSHTRIKFLTAKLTKELAAKLKIKRLSVKTGDKAKVLRGKFKGKEGKIDFVNLKKSTVYIVGAEITKKDGSKAKIPIHASNLMLLEVNTDDKKRLAKQIKK
jgi:large subunit ribosomal protein L24